MYRKKCFVKDCLGNENLCCSTIKLMPESGGEGWWGAVWCDSGVGWGSSKESGNRNQGKRYWKNLRKFSKENIFLAFYLINLYFKPFEVLSPGSPYFSRRKWKATRKSHTLLLNVRVFSGRVISRKERLIEKDSAGTTYTCARSYTQM